MSDRRPVDQCQSCGRFVGYYPVGFYDDRYCRRCYDERLDRALAIRETMARYREGRPLAFPTERARLR